MNTWLSLLPPVVAIALAIRTRQVLLSLFFGIFSGALILAGGRPLAAFTGAFELLVGVLADPGNLRILLFSLLIGSVVMLLERSGGVDGFVSLVSHTRWVDSPRKAQFLTTLMGAVLFIEGSISILVTGTVARPLFEKFRLSREKLAYLADSTCAPLKVLIPLNGWGAFLLAQFHQAGIEKPAALLAASLPFFFYPLAAFVLTLLVILFCLDFGPMQKAEAAAQRATPPFPEEEGKQRGQAVLFIVPIAVLVISLFAFMAWTGGGRLLEGDGSRSILYAIGVTLAAAWPLYRFRAGMKTAVFMQAVVDGMRHLLEVVAILALAFGINQVCRELGTGRYAAGLLSLHLPVFLVPCLLFVLSAAIAFATGTSWGTFAIMLGIAIPLAGEMGIALPLAVGAVVSGGVWGDHSSPVSDTTVLAALASDCPLLQHFRTQLPYALAAGGFSALLFLIAGGLVT